jgi:excisionase family DNA binding protein
MKSLRRETAQEILKDYQALMSVEEVAEALRCVTKTVRNLIAEEHLECTRIGRTIYVSKDSVLEYICRPVDAARYRPRKK